MLAVNVSIRDAGGKCRKWSRKIKALVDKMSQIHTVSKQTLVRQQRLEISESLLGRKVICLPFVFSPSMLLILTTHLSFHPFGLLCVSSVQ